MRFIAILITAVFLGGCANLNNSSLDEKELLCTFYNSSNQTVDFSLKFSEKKVQIISWWIDREYKNLVIDYHKDENDIFREYKLDTNINILTKIPNSMNRVFIKIDKDTLQGKYTDQSFDRNDLKCSEDSKASYKMSLKIAIGKKNYDAYAKQKGF